MDDSQAVMLVAGMMAFMLAAFAAFLLARRSADRASQNPRVILRRCKVELQSVRCELMKLPAGRATYDLIEDLERTDRMIDETAAALK